VPQKSKFLSFILYWDRYVDTTDLWWQFARFAEIVDKLDPAGERFQPAMIAHPELRPYAFKGKNTTLVWGRDIEDSWQSELADGVRPRELRSVTIDLSSVTSLAGATVFAYAPWSAVWTDTEPERDTITLPAFKRSIVVRITR
jgi:hypothetical protein